MRSHRLHSGVTLSPSPFFQHQRALSSTCGSHFVRAQATASTTMRDNSIGQPPATDPTTELGTFSMPPSSYKAALALSRAKRVTVFSGAGMSAESGIVTFRDPEVGVWKNKLKLALFGTPFGWRWLPGYAWSNYRQFHAPIFQGQPNAGHKAIADLWKSLGLEAPEAVQVVTQNVDYLHQRAGNPPDTVFEVHGSIFRHRCIAKGHPIPVAIDQPLPEKQPVCDQCGSKARPDAVLFTESLPEDTWANARRAMGRLQHGDVLLVIGTSGVVQPAASLPDYIHASGVTRIELNTEPSGHTEHMDVFVRGPSAQSLPAIIEQAAAMKAERPRGGCFRPGPTMSPTADSSEL